jgi:hypothetical protein
VSLAGLFEKLGGWNFTVQSRSRLFGSRASNQVRESDADVFVIPNSVKANSQERSFAARILRVADNPTIPLLNANLNPLTSPDMRRLREKAACAQSSPK